MLKIVQGDLLDAVEQYIIHQCNCVTNKSAGIALRIFERFPYANIYAERGYPHDPQPGGMMGDIVVRGNGDDQRFVINALAQYYPGRPKFPEGKRDGIEARKAALRSCLSKVSAIKGIDSIAFPCKMGCRLGGGHWPDYLAIIEQWASENPSISVAIYDLDLPRSV